MAEPNETHVHHETLLKENNIITGEPKSLRNISHLGTKR